MPLRLDPPDQETRVAGESSLSSLDSETRRIWALVHSAARFCKSGLNEALYIMMAISRTLPARVVEWTRNRPTKAGLYWFRGRIELNTFKHPTVVEIMDNGANLMTRILGRGAWPLVNQADGEWYGPIEPPPE
jgi:hypothetical protein